VACCSKNDQKSSLCDERKCELTIQSTPPAPIDKYCGTRCTRHKRKHCTTTRKRRYSRTCGKVVCHRRHDSRHVRCVLAHGQISSRIRRTRNKRQIERKFAIRRSRAVFSGQAAEMIERHCSSIMRSLHVPRTFADLLR
jgi:hypothetical protein